MVPITFRFIIPLTWCRRWLITSSWNLSTNVSWSSSTLCALPGYRLSSWWEIPSLPSMICVIIDHFIAFPPTQACSCLVLYLEFLAIQQLFFFTLEYYHLLCQVCRKNFTTSHDILVQWYFSPSPFFLVPVLFLKGIPTNGLWCVNSKLLATLLLWSYWSIVSFYVYGLMNHHSNIDCAT